MENKIIQRSIHPRLRTTSSNRKERVRRQQHQRNKKGNPLALITRNKGIMRRIVRSYIQN